MMERKGCEKSRLGQLAEASMPMPRTRDQCGAQTQAANFGLYEQMRRCVGWLPDEAWGLLPTI